jgi:multiple sugar transport system permease protein
MALLIRERLRAGNSGVLALVPAAVAFLSLLAFPTALFVWLSIERAGKVTFAGYLQVLADPGFWDTLHVTISYTLWTVALQLLLGVLAAATVFSVKRSTTLVTSLLFLPYAVPSVVSVVLWRFLVDKNGVVAVTASTFLGIDPDVWMADWIFTTLVIVSVWQFFPFVFVTLLARMKRIPAALYHAAEVDGAGPWERFWYVALPQLRGTLAAIAVLRMLFMATKFDTPWLLAGGTALANANTLPVYVYMHSGSAGGIGGRAGPAAAVLAASVIGCVVLLVAIGRSRHRGQAGAPQ